MDNYLSILEESLRKKIALLDRIEEYNLHQYEALTSEETDLDMFDSFIEEKEHLIQELNLLDEGFETLYSRVSTQIKENREKYADQIRVLQGLIQKITDKSVSVQAQEARNKAAVEAYFKKRRQAVGESRRSMKAAVNYYRMQSNSSYVQPQFMDDKK